MNMVMKVILRLYMNMPANTDIKLVHRLFCILRRLVASDAMINGHPAIVNGHLLGGAL